MESRTNFMFDSETLATTPRAVVRSISIIPFKLVAEESIESLMSRQLTVWLDAEAQLEAGREVDEDTLEWWNKQLNESTSEEARANAEAILGRHPEDMHPRDALHVLAAYIQDECPDGFMMSRGSNFDFPIIEDLYRTFGVTLPFSTWKITCSKSILRFVCADDKKMEASLVGGLKSSHDSAYDCAVEAKKLQVVYATLNSN